MAPEDQATLRHSASSTHSTTGSSSSRPMSNADHVRALAHDQKDESMVHPDEGLVLSSDRVSAAYIAGGITQTRQITSSLTGIAKRNGQTLVLAIVANPQASASGVTYHLTVPPRYLELGNLRRELNISGKFGEAALAARDAYVARIDDNNWREQSGHIASQTSFADYSRARRMELIEQQGAVDRGMTRCPFIVHMDLVGRRRRTRGILSFVVTVPSGTIPVPWTLRPGHCTCVCGTSRTTPSPSEEKPACSRYWTSATR